VEESIKNNINIEEGNGFLLSNGYMIFGAIIIIDLNPPHKDNYLAVILVENNL